MFITSLFIITPNRKQPKCLTRGKCYQLWNIHTMENNSAIKRNKQLTYNTCMMLKGIMLGEKTQSEKVTYYIIPFIWHSKTKLQQWGPTSSCQGLKAGERMTNKGDNIIRSFFGMMKTDIPIVVVIVWPYILL